MSKQDYYETLGVQKNASDSDLRKAYRRKAMKLHPDRNLDDAAVAEGKFKEVQEAYSVLKDQQKRAAYDQFGHAGVDPSGAGAGAGGAGFGDMFGDIFGDIFSGGGRGGQGGGSHRGSDLQYNLELSLEDAAFGTKVDIRIPSAEKCEPCNGTGAKTGTHPETCSTCHGQGQVRMQQGFFSVQQPCPQCRGSGKIIANPCNTCHGQGRIEKPKTLSVTIPEGVDTGDRIRLSGEGEMGSHGGMSGDLYVQVSVKEHHLFTREGNDLHIQVPLGFTTAALGGDLTVPTLKGKVKLKIPAETQTGKRFRVGGKGVKSVRSSQMGDLYCHIIIETPVNLTKEQKELLAKFEETMGKGGKKHSPKEHSWADSVKSKVKDWLDN